MLHKMDIDTMRQLLRQENPAWADSYIQRTAVKYVTEMDDSLDEPLWTYAKDGHKTDLRRGEFSLLMIPSLRCSPAAVMCRRRPIWMPISKTRSSERR